MSHSSRVFHTKRHGRIAIPTIFRQKLAENKVQPQLEVTRHLRHSSVTAIQRCFRLHQARTAFLTMRRATLQVQRVTTRGFASRCNYKSQLLVYISYDNCKQSVVGFSDNGGR